jgi:hypothetical protein
MDITGIGSMFDFGGKVLDKIFPDETQRAAAKLELFKAQQAGEFKEMEIAFELSKAQIDTNKIEAASDKVFVAGWRPAIGWICGVSLAYSAIIEPIARFVAAVCFKYVGVFPIIDSTITMQLLFALLGLGAMRSYDKKNIIK